FCHMNYFSFTGDLDVDMHRHGGGAYASGLRVKTNHLTDHHRLFENHLFDSDSHDLLARVSRHLHGTGHIDVAKNNSTKNGAMPVGVAGQKHYSNGRIPARDSGLVIRHRDPPEKSFAA